MSHWKKFESNVLANSKKELLRAALGEMNVELDETLKSIKNSWGHEAVDAGLRVNGKQIALGLNFKTNAEGVENVELSGDFYGTGLSENGFIDKLAQIYQKHNIVEKCESQNWIIDSIKTTASGEIEIEAYQWS